MPPVRRHRIGDQLPAVVHPDPDPAALALCRDLVAETDVDSTVLFGSRYAGGWDEQSDLDIIVIHQDADDESARAGVYRILHEIKERHYPGYGEYESPDHGVADGPMVVSPEHYVSHRCTNNDVMARAAREGLVFCRESGTEHSYRHDGDVSNEWELVSLERLWRASEESRWLADLPRFWHPRPLNSVNVNTAPGRNAHRLLWNSGAALLSLLGVIYPRDSVAEMARSIVEHDPGWTHEFRSDLDRIDQYAHCGCEVVVTDPIDDVPAMWRDLEGDRDALWERIRDRSGYDLAAAKG